MESYRPKKNKKYESFVSHHTKSSCHNINAKIPFEKKKLDEYSSNYTHTQNIRLNSIAVYFNIIDQTTNPTTESRKVSRNEIAFKIFLKNNLSNQAYTNKYVVFVNEKFFAVGNNENELIDKVFSKFGYIDMYVGKMTLNMQRELVDSPL